MTNAETPRTSQTRRNKKKSEKEESYGKAYFEGGGISKYESYGPERILKHRDLAKALLKLLGTENSIKSVFDAGCAKGFLVKAFLDEGIKATGCDVSQYAISEGRTQYDLPVHVCALTDLPITAPVDLVLCLEVLEHIPREHLLPSIHGLIKQTKKWIIITVPDMERHTPEMFFEGDLTHLTYAPRRLWIKWVFEAGKKLGIPLVIREDIMGEFNRLAISRRRWKHAMIFDRNHPMTREGKMGEIRATTIQRLRWTIADVIFTLKKTGYKFLKALHLRQ